MTKLAPEILLLLSLVLLPASAFFWINTRDDALSLIIPDDLEFTPSTESHFKVGLQNNTNLVLQLNIVGASCSCTKATLPPELKPKSKAELSVKLHTPPQKGIHDIQIQVQFYEEGSSERHEILVPISYNIREPT